MLATGSGRRAETGCYDTRRVPPLPDFLRDAAGFLAFVLRRWREDRCPQIAGSLTFTTLLALVPLFTVAVAVLSALPFFEDAMTQLKVFLLLNLVPEIAGRIITVYLGQFAEAAGRLTSVSLVALVAMSLAMLHTVDRSLNVIWRVDRHRPLWRSVLVYAAILAMGPVLIGLSLWATSWLAAASVSRLAMPSPVVAVWLRAVPITVSVLGFFLVYTVFPNRRVPPRDALAGALAAAVAFELMKGLFADYIQAVPTYRLVYGAFASIPIFLLWLYLSWLVLLMGAELTAALSWWPGGRWRQEAQDAAAAPAAFAVGRVLSGAATPLSTEALQKATGLPAGRLAPLLEELARGGTLRRVRGGWALARPRRLRTARCGRARSGPSSR